MPSYKEGDRFLYLDTPLGPDKLLLRGFRGQEAISELFTFQLDLMAENATTVDFDKLLGQRVNFGILGVEQKDQRHFNGIVVELSQGGRGREFTGYRMTVAPDIWKLSRCVQSRIFQHISVPDILKKALTGYDVIYELQGTFEPREYCVQYRESDLDFISRLMEEEGIYYFFKFPDRGQHKLVLGNTTTSHKDVPINPNIVFETMAGGGRDDLRIGSWEKAQYWGSGKHKRRDHHFQLPQQKLEVEQTALDTVSVGKVQHKLKVSGNDAMEVYDYPGDYAQPFDGIDKAGGEKPADLNKIFQYNKSTIGLEMQETEARMLLISGDSNCRQLTAGHKFTLQRHFNADGPYVVVGVSHEAREGSFRSGGDEDVESHYNNTFGCIPFALPYRPPFVTPCPTIAGPQTAKVVGPKGEEIFTDKYGRVKVQFHWDRDGKEDADSSCWLRVGTLSSGNNWGSIYIPRIGMDVIVSFLEGDPDRPLIVGCVYNPDQMPPYTLPDHKTVSTIKSHSTLQGGKDNFNELRFEDLKGSEQLFLHAEKDKDERVKNESREFVGASSHMIVTNDRKEDIGGEWHTKVKGTRVVEVGGDQGENLKGAYSIKVSGDHQQKTGGNFLYESGGEIHLKAGMKVIIEAPQVTLSGMGGFDDVGPSGVTIQGIMVLINSGGAAREGTPASPNVPAPDKPAKADDGTKFGKLE